MGVFQTVIGYTDANSGLSWKIKSVRDAVDAPTASLASITWNDLYLAACAATVAVVDGRISRVDVNLDTYVINHVAFNFKAGQIGGLPTEIASYAQWRGYGNTGNRGSSGWKLHGISESLVEGSKLDEANPVIVALSNGSNVYFLQYRADATPAPNLLPVVDPPAPFGTYQLSGMYSRRLGRSFLSPGQQRRMVRP